MGSANKIIKKPSGNAMPSIFTALELRAEDKGSKEAGFIQLGLGIVALAGGIYLVGKQKK